MQTDGYTQVKTAKETGEIVGEEEDFCGERGKPSLTPAVKKERAAGRWSSLCSLLVAAWMLAAVSFYMLRFLVSVWDAGDRGLFGM